MNTYLLNEVESEKLLNPVRGGGEYKELIVNLQRRFNLQSFKIKLTSDEKDRIVKFVSFVEGGTESRLVDIFSRHIPELNFEDFEDEHSPIKLSFNEVSLNYVLFRSNSRTAREIIERINNEKFVIDSDSKSMSEWNKIQQSKFIESCILRIPQFGFYVVDRTNGTFTVIDGLKRIMTLKNFVEGKFKLVGLDENTELIGQNFNDLSINYQERLIDTYFGIYVMDAKTPLQIGTEIFERLKGDPKFSRQQMRNTLYFGKATDWLKSISMESVFIEVTQGSLNRLTMRDREAINRFISFYLLDIEDYRHGEMDGFLANGLTELEKLSIEELEKLRNLFCFSMKLNYELFGVHAFRKSLCSEHGTKTPINLALFEVLSVSFARLIEGLDILECSKFRKITKKELLKKIVIDLLKNKEFYDSISIGTNGKTAVEVRNKMVSDKILTYLANHH